MAGTPADSRGWGCDKKAQTEPSTPSRLWRVPTRMPSEACAPPEDGILAGGSPGAEGVVTEALLEIAATLSFLTRLANVDPCKIRMPNWLLLS